MLYNIQSEKVKMNGNYNAAGKPIFDSIETLRKMGFTSLSDVGGIKKGLTRILFERSSLANYFSKIRNGDTVLIQYPLYIPYPAFVQLLRALKNKHVRIIFFVHDINSLRISRETGIRSVGRARTQTKSLENEIRLLQYGDNVIVPTSSLKEYLQSKGLQHTKFTVLGIYDYLDYSRAKIVEKDKVPQNLIFAGNLSKATFLSDKNVGLNFQYQVFGILPSGYKLSPNIQYCGAYPSEQLVDHFSTGFGLVWDGDSSDKISGAAGEYLRFNSPFKASMLIASGIPLVVWKNSGISKFVEEKAIGIVVDSLQDAEYQILNMSNLSYRKMVEAVIDQSQRLKTGSMLEHAVKSALISID